MSGPDNPDVRVLGHSSSTTAVDTAGNVLWEISQGFEEVDTDSDFNTYGISGTTVYSYATDGTLRWSKSLNDPTAITASEGGHVYVTDGASTSATVTKLDSSTGGIVWQNSGGGTDIYDSHVDSNGNLYQTIAGSDISKVDSTGTVVWDVTVGDPGHSILGENEDYFYVTERSAGEILKVDVTDGTTVATRVPAALDVLSIDDDGYLYLKDYGSYFAKYDWDNDTILWTYDAGGVTRYPDIQPSYGSGVFALVSDSGTDVQEIHRLEDDGTYVETILSNPSYNDSETLGAVPDIAGNPTAWEPTGTTAGLQVDKTVDASGSATAPGGSATASSASSPIQASSQMQAGAGTSTAGPSPQPANANASPSSPTAASSAGATAGATAASSAFGPRTPTIGVDSTATQLGATSTLLTALAKEGVVYATKVSGLTTTSAPSIQTSTSTVAGDLQEAAAVPESTGHSTSSTTTTTVTASSSPTIAAGLRRMIVAAGGVQSTSSASSPQTTSTSAPTASTVGAVTSGTSPTSTASAAPVASSVGATGNLFGPDVTTGFVSIATKPLATATLLDVVQFTPRTRRLGGDPNQLATAGESNSAAVTSSSNGLSQVGGGGDSALSSGPNQLDVQDD